MELFDQTNEFYVNSSCFPKLPPPQFVQTRREAWQSQNIRLPQYIKFQPVILHVPSSNRPAPHLSIKSKIITINPFMVKVNASENESVVKDVNSLKSGLKQIKKLFERKQMIQQAIIPGLVSDLNLDITEQRGQNNFIHKRDYLDDSIKLLAPTLHGTNASFILKTLKQTYATQDLILLQTEQCSSEMERLCNEIGCKIEQIASQSYGSMSSNYDGTHMTQLVDEVSRQRIALVYFEQSTQIDKYIQWLFMVTFVFGILSDGGTLIIRCSDISQGQISYLIYLCSVTFQEFVMEKQDDNYSMFQNSFIIGCYGFRSQQGRIYASDLLQNYDTFKSKTVGLFDYRIMLHDNEFEKEFTQFNSSLFKYRQQQQSLMSWCQQQIQMGIEPQLISLQIIQDRQNAIENNIKIQADRADRAASKQPYVHGHSLNQRQIINQVPTGTIYNSSMFSPDRVVRRIRDIKVPVPHQHPQNQHIQQMEREKLAKLLLPLPKQKSDR